MTMPFTPGLDPMLEAALQSKNREELKLVLHFVRARLRSIEETNNWTTDILPVTSCLLHQIGIVSCTGISSRVKKVLFANNLITLGDVQEAGKRGLSGIRFLGTTALEELNQELLRYGYELSE